MLARILSGDRPRSPILTATLLVILFALAFAPFLFSGAQPLNVAAKICVFILLVASYDLLLGYTGIVSFAHTMFFGIGGYGAAIALSRLGPSWSALALGILIAIAVAGALALVIGLFSLRVRAIFFAMITLAVATAFLVLASQLSGFTGGEDGLNYSVPEVLRPSFRLFEQPIVGTAVNGRVVTYYIVFLAALAGFLLLLRVVNSPFGSVLQAIRENEFRAEALGYPVVVYRSIASVVSAMMAALAGVLLALWLRYTGPDTTLSFSIMIDVLLMVVIGGMGTLYGAAIGATLMIIAENYLPALMGKLGAAAAGIPLVSSFLSADRWLLWLGILFILSVYFFPTGIVGKLRTHWQDRRNGTAKKRNGARTGEAA
ncbi:MAG: branched-chain amino acid ABC transporter permease [Xanthobacteraceae bacterium]|nr:branched-chain amino acid ABC transporter permease [Xanthobacteraceae bacterium]MCW5676981.1 branched-chain amino acid ABC transporter permease [Xanthobacteraceae bacterium]